ncbi:MAG: GTPase domain-containing protein [Candidatus Lokiarchaeota archaeon]
MIYNYETKEIQVKIVYYGPAMSGKTTSIKFLFHFFNKFENISSIENSMGRTLFFDFGVLKFQGSEWTLKFLIYSATGQDFYSSTRPATLNGVDGVIFVLDSQYKKLNYNINSWRELCQYFGSKLYQMPIIINLNKYDLDDRKKIIKEDIFDLFKLNFFRYLKIKKTSAIDGKGIIDSFKEIINYIFPKTFLTSFALTFKTDIN